LKAVGFSLNGSTPMTNNLNYKAEETFNRSSAITRESARPVLDALAQGFQITWFREVETKIWIAALKPSASVREQFGLRQEYFMIGNGHDKDFHQKTLNIPIPTEIADRTDANLRFVASNAPVAPAFCAAWAKKNKVTVVVLPPHLDGKSEGPVPELFSFLSRTLWRRDFFSESEPVRSPSEFFGREVVVNELLFKILSGMPTAVFGLRKVGKSSLLGRVDDLLRDDSSSVVGTAFLLGNATRLKSGRWWNFAQDALKKWCLSLHQAAEKYGSRIRPRAERVNDLLDKNKLDAALLARAFESDVVSLIKCADSLSRESGGGSGRLVLFLDECDHLYPLAKDSNYWRSDFFILWNTIQSIKRSLDDPAQLVYVLSGVNPSGIEQGALDGQPNPLYECDRIYLAPMSELEVASLLRGLGERMGLGFEDSAVEKVFALVGGHPLLVRRLGSAVHEVTIDRSARLPVTEKFVERSYERKKRDFFNQVTWILEHLALVAPDEERLLRNVAQGGVDAYSDVWGDSEYRETFAYHLERYGLLEFKDDLPVLKLEIVREALRRPVASDFREQKRLLKDVVDSLEVAIRIRIRDDLERERSADEAVNALVSAIPSDSKNRALGREALIELGSFAGVDPVLQALNWGDYELVLRKFYREISWTGRDLSEVSRLSQIAETFKLAHIVRHNNDHELKKLIDELGYGVIYGEFSELRETVSS
jgi:hypothetical protein